MIDKLNVPPEHVEELRDIIDTYEAAKDKAKDAAATKKMCSDRMAQLLREMDTVEVGDSTSITVDGFEVAVLRKSAPSVNHVRAEQWATEHPIDAEAFRVIKLDTAALARSQFAARDELLSQRSLYFKAGGTR